jgi:hypothetical protein
MHNSVSNLQLVEQYRGHPQGVAPPTQEVEGAQAAKEEEEVDEDEEVNKANNAKILLVTPCTQMLRSIGTHQRRKFP